MKRKSRQSLTWFFVVCAILLMFSRPTTGRCQSPSLSFQESLSPEAKQAVAGQYAWAADFYNHLSKQKGNLVFSPYSISTALRMTYAGARGKTAAEMEEVLHLSLEQGIHPAFGELRKVAMEPFGDDKIELSIANSLWVQTDLLDSFQKIMKACYGGNFFAGISTPAINQWVANQTKGQIKNLITLPLNPELARLVLVNAVYYKGEWGFKFPKEFTKPAPFTRSDGSSVTVAMMQCNLASNLKSTNFYEDSQTYVVEWPYGPDDTFINEASMMIVVPKETNGLNTLRITSESLRRWSSMEGSERRVVIFYLPKFKMSWHNELSHDLAVMGMTNAFDMGNADFSGMTGDKGLFIRYVFHQSTVDVNEIGTVATAGTAVAMYIGSPGPQPVKVVVDHPFLFLIVDKRTGCILFLGRVEDPTAAGME